MRRKAIELTTTRNTRVGRRSGSVTFTSERHAPAPSMAAAS
jgi:hypothetical protein